MPLLEDLPPEEYRRRYDALLSAARARSEKRPTLPPPPLADSMIVQRETIPGGWYWSTFVARGMALRLVNTAATPGMSVLLWNADESVERLNVADTMKLQWTARIAGGHVLLSDMGRVLASVTADTCGWHDLLLGGSTAASTAARHGRSDLRNSRDNFLRAAGKHGLGVRDVPPCITFFAGVETDAAGRFHWRAGTTRPGDIVDLRAEMNLLAVVSNSPHPLAPGDAVARPVEVIVWQAPLAAADDPCRTCSPEAARAFANTERYLTDPARRPSA